VPWSHCPNKNVFSVRLNWPYDSPGYLSLAANFHTLVPVATNVLSPKLLDVRLTASVRVSAERILSDTNVGDELTVKMILREPFGTSKVCAGQALQILKLLVKFRKRTDDIKRYWDIRNSCSGTWISL